LLSSGVNSSKNEFQFIDATENGTPNRLDYCLSMIFSSSIDG
jgi:hypothetical protein